MKRSQATHDYDSMHIDGRNDIHGQAHGTVRGISTLVLAVVASAVFAGAGMPASANAASAPNEPTAVAAITKIRQSIRFTALAGRTMGAAPVVLSASSSAGLAVEFGAVVDTATGSTVCTVTGATVILIGTGTCTIVASQRGNANVRAAANVSQSFTVTPGALIVTIVSPVNNQQLSTPANLTIVATALERGGTIARVVFYNGSTVLGTVTEPGLQPASQPASQLGSQASITLPDVAIGSYKLTAKATDGTGKTVISSAVAVSVVAGMPTTKGDGEMHYIVTDQLGTPRQVMDSKGVTVWQWDGEAFGNTPPNANPGGQGDFVFNLRFPGQYFDAETNLNQNYYRDYDSSTGRYVESDPIGLGGGISTYAHVGGNPISYIDPDGLNPVAGAIAGVEIGTAILPGPGTVVGAVVGTVIGVGIGMAIDTAMQSRSQGAGPEARPADVNPGKDCDGKCKPCPPNPPDFDHQGDAHGSDRGFHTHQWQYHQAPDCTCRARKESW